MLDAHAKATRELFLTIQDELEQREDDLKEGLSFLDMKNDTLLSYMIDVCNIILRKVRGDTIENHPSVERCVEYRVILEKIKAIDQKLAYQLNKLITLPEDAVEEDQRIDVNNLDIDLEGVESDAALEENEESDDDSVDGENESGEENSSEDHSDIISDDDKRPEPSRAIQKPNKNASGVYKPPKLRSVVYTDGRRKDYSEFYQEEDPHDESRPREDERTRYEEDNYTRLPDENPKKAKRKLRTKEYRRKGPNKRKRR